MPQGVAGVVCYVVSIAFALAKSLFSEYLLYCLILGVLSLRK